MVCCLRTAFCLFSGSFCGRKIYFADLKKIRFFPQQKIEKADQREEIIWKTAFL